MTNRLMVAYASFDFSYIYFMLLQALTFYTMLFIPSSSSSSYYSSSAALVSHKRKLITTSFCLAQLYFVILCFLVHTTKAGVIKKRDIVLLAATQHDNTETHIKETEVAPTILTALNNASADFMNDQNVATTETTKELTNNEILINEAKELLREQEDKVKKSKIQEENSRDKETLPQKSQDTRQDMKHFINGPETTTEFSSNDIKAEEMPKFGEQQVVLTTDNKENSAKLFDLSPRPPSRILTELRTETEKPLQNPQIDNSIEISKEYSIKNKLKLQNKDKSMMPLVEAVTVEPLEMTTAKTFSTSVAANKYSTTSQTSADVNEIKEPLETSRVTENGQVLNMTSIEALENPKSGNQIKSREPSTKTDSDRQSNQIYNGLERQAMLKPVRNQPMVYTTSANMLNLDETTTKTATKEHDSLIFESNKQEYARSMFREETTTLNFREVEGETFIPVTTFKPQIFSIKDAIEETSEEYSKDHIEDLSKNDLALASPTNVKAKKPKFINDNSTNAQQLNLPNNADVWSLAGMKSLPKANITMEMAQTHNHSSIHEFKQLHNTSMTLNNNSEKNLLDWSQIMMDKELSTTARNEDNIRPEELAIENKKPQESEIENKDEYTKDLETGFVSTTTTAAAEMNDRTEFKTQPLVDVITENSLLEQEESNTSTMSPATTSTILSSLTHNEQDKGNSNQLDKKVEENMNNHIETLMTSTTLATATVPTNVDNNPFNATLNIEPNLNEINLTSNQNQVILNNKQQSKTTAGNTITTSTAAANDDVNADTFIETSTVAAMTTTATATTTSTSDTNKATAVTVVDMSTVEQISSETTTVSTLATGKPNTLLNNVAIIQQQQQQQQNKTNNVINEESNSSLSGSHNELENTLVDTQTTQYNNIIDLNTKTSTPIITTTVVPLNTLKPNILAITSTTSTTPATLEQEVDQKSNEIQTNSKQQSIIKNNLQNNHTTQAIDETHLTKNGVHETTTTHDEALTTTTATSTSTAATTELYRTTSEIENTLISNLNNESATTTTSSSSDETLNVTTTEINLETSEAAAKTTQTTTPKQVLEHKNTEDAESTTGSAVSEDEKFEKGSKIEAATTTTTEADFSTKPSTETPVVIDNESTTPAIATATITTTTTIIAEQNTTATTTTTPEQQSETKKNNLSQEDVQIETTTMNMNNTQGFTTKTTTTAMPFTAVEEEEETYISLLDDTTTGTTSTTLISTTSHPPPKTPTTTLSPLSSSSSTTLPSAVTTKVEEIYNVINSTTTELIETTTQQLLTDIVVEEEEVEATSEVSATTTTSSSTSSYFTEMLATTQTPQIIATADIGKTLPTLTTIMGGNSGNMYPKSPEASGETDVNVIIAITVSVIGVIALVLLVGFLYLMRKRQKQTSYSQRCRPVSLDEYTIDNASVSGSMRKSSALRASKRTYGNLAFDDPALRPNPLGVHELAKFVQERLRIFEEFRDVPQITSRLDEVPTGCEDKNRYANVLPLPETRVILQRVNDDEKSEYINANYVTGPKDPPNYYIACQAPLETTVEDFWRMIWEQQSRVIIQATDLIENGVEKCAEYLPPSVTLDNHSTFGDFQITLQNREVKDKYAISTILIKHVGENVTRELTHYWYKWPEVGVPTEEAPIIAMLLEARSSLISYAIEQANEDKEKLSTDTLQAAEEGTNANSANDSTTSKTNNSNGSTATTAEINGNISLVHIKKPARNQGPLTVHCSPGTGRTGTIIACDIAMRSLETPKRTVDIPQIVYYVRRGRASAVLTKEQYEFIYKVASMYVAKITNPTHYN